MTLRIPQERSSQRQTLPPPHCCPSGLDCWFTLELLRRESRRRGSPLDVCELAASSEFATGCPALLDARTGSKLAIIWDTARALEGKEGSARLDPGPTIDLNERFLSLPRQYDALILMHGLSHLHDPAGTFFRLRPFLSQGGIFVGSFPVSPAWWTWWCHRGQRGSDAPAAAPPLRGLRELAAGAGLDLEFVGGTFLLRRAPKPGAMSGWWFRLNLFAGASLPWWPGKVFWQMRKPASIWGVA